MLAKAGVPRLINLWAPSQFGVFIFQEVKGEWWRSLLDWYNFHKVEGEGESKAAPGLQGFLEKEVPNFSSPFLKS